jgi:lysophospholipase L1-like esterase
LRSRGVLTGGKSTKQVWSNESNTMALDLNILQKTINYPETGQAMTIPKAAAVEKPRYIVLNFGVNGIQTFSKNEKLYTMAYGKLIDAIHQSSPNTVVLLQTVYPVAANQTTFGEGAEIINGYIARLNALLPDIAVSHDAYVVDTASVLVGSDGNLRADYQSGDGIHLTEAAYVQIVTYLRTHGYIK